MSKKYLHPGEKVSLKLTATERKLILQDLMCLNRNSEQILQRTPSRKPVMMTLDDLDELGEYIAAEANHCDDKRKQKKLDAIFQKVQDVLGRYSDEVPPQTIKIEDARKEKGIADQAAIIAEWAAQALVAAEQLRIKTKPLENFWLAPAQRDCLLQVPGLAQTVKNKLAKDSSRFPVAEVAGMIMALAEDYLDGDARQQVTALLVAGHLMERLQDGIAGAAQPATSKRKPKAKAAVASLIQFRITLLGSAPEIWRRIQVQDCTLDKLHEHIQTAMGWTNSHLHEFEIKGERYGDPALWDGGFEEYDGSDSTTTMISDILPKRSKRFAFKYVYDFGDSWEHGNFIGGLSAD